MYLFVLYIPLISVICTGLFGKFLGKKGVVIINISSMIMTFLVSSFIFIEVCLYKYTCLIILGDWINCGVLNLSFEFLFDAITAVMLLVVSFISLLVHIYSLEYMKADPHLIRFMTYLSLFTFFMFVLVTSGNFVQLFLGWEGVGLASYLLVNFWFTRTQANISALKAVIVNRFGDFAVYIAMLLIFFTFKTLSFYSVFSLSYAFSEETITIFGYKFYLLTLISFFLFMGAVGKSAQVGLHIWLPDAMEGPTPVSALIHAATMVTAGIFLIIRCSPILEYSPSVLVIITIFGALTAFISATIGLVQNDIKKVIAYSTCSQLGYMIFACGLSNYSASFFHLINHAFFKALLFLCAGSVIHALMDEQDIRRMGGLAKLLPLTYVLMLIGSLSLLGFPFLTGFYSKDVILELAYSHYSVSGLFAYWLGTISVFFTAFYSCRLLHLTFWTKVTSAYKEVLKGAHEPTYLMFIALIPLAFGSIFWGYLTKDMFIGLGTDFWQNSIFILPKNYIIIEAEFLPTYIKLIPFFFSMFGVGMSFIVYYSFINFHLLEVSPLFLNVYNFFAKKWLFDFVYLHFIYKPFFLFSYFITLKVIDRGLLEYFGPLGIVRYLNKLSMNLSRLQSGFIFHYIFFAILAIMFIMFMLLFNGDLIYLHLSGEFLFVLLCISVVTFNYVIRFK